MVTGHVLVVDLTSVTFHRSSERGALAVVTPSGQLLGSVVVHDGATAADMAFMALDAVAAGSTVIIDDPDSVTGVVRARVCWYNPFTAQVSLGPAASGTIVTCACPVELDADGTLGIVVKELDGSLRLEVSGMSLTQVGDIDVPALTRSVQAHSY